MKVFMWRQKYHI